MVNNRLDAIYGALADPTRRRMVERLSGGALSVSDLGAPFDMTLAAIGKHIGVLESAGIVSTSKTGRIRSCRMVPGALAPADAWLGAQTLFWNNALDALETHLEVNP